MDRSFLLGAHRCVRISIGIEEVLKFRYRRLETIIYIEKSGDDSRRNALDIPVGGAISRWKSSSRRAGGGRNRRNIVIGTLIPSSFLYRPRRVYSRARSGERLPYGERIASPCRERNRGARSKGRPNAYPTRHRHRHRPFISIARSLCRRTFLVSVPRSFSFHLSPSSLLGLSVYTHAPIAPLSRASKVSSALSFP